MQSQHHEANPSPAGETHPGTRPAKHDEFSAQFGAEGLSLKIALPRWAKTVLAILLAIGLLESLVVLKAIEIHDRYEQSQIAHNRLVAQLTEEIRTKEQEKNKAEKETQAFISLQAAERHRMDPPSSIKVLRIPYASGAVSISFFPNQDILITRQFPNQTVASTWLLAPNVNAE